MANKNRPFVVCIIFMISKFLRKVKQKNTNIKFVVFYIKRNMRNTQKDYTHLVEYAKILVLVLTFLPKRNII